MHNEVRQQLCQLIAQYGRSLSEDPRRCQALLKDYCGQHKREIFVLISALKNRVAEDLLKAPVGIPQSIVLARLNKRLEDELGFTEEAARWAVEAWAFALEILEQPLPVNQPVTTPPTNQPAPTPSSEPSPEIIEGFGIITPPATASSPRLSALPLAPAAKPVATPPPATAPITVASPPLPLTQSMANRYRDNGDGTVTDKQTGLQWIRFSLGQTWISGACIGNANGYQWQGAIDKVNMLNRQGGYAGYRDWRLPTKEELLTLIYCTSGQPHIWNDTGNPCQGNYKTPTIDQIAFPNTPSFSWSSSISVNKDYAWCVRFDNGCVSDYSKRLYFNIRLVRGKSSATIIPPKKPVTPNSNHSTSTIHKPKKEGYILNILVFLFLNPKIAFGLALIVYMIFFIGYKMIYNTIVNHRLNSYISDKANEQIKSPYHNNKDGTVIDSLTNLQWMRCSFGQVWQENSCTDQSQSYTWPEAIYATKLLNRQGGYSGFTDWRLPTKEELLTLVYCSSSQPKLWNETGNSCQGNYEKPTIHQKTFPNNPAKWFWSSSTNEEGSVWDIYFVEGNAAVHQKTTVGSFRLVRNYQIPSIATSNESNFLSEPVFEKAKAGDSDAQFKLGLMYANGQGVSKNDIEAVRWYRLAAGQGNAKAQNRLGRLYDDGESVPKDTIEAVKWYRLAADQGYSVAQYNLGRMYEEGQGIPKNIEEAAKWYHLATVQGDADAKKRLAIITLTDRYLDHGDGTVTDVQTHLQWMRCSLGQEWKGNTCVGNNQKYTWQLAINAADTLNHQGGYAGFSDWRLPIKEELLTLVYCSNDNPNRWNNSGNECKGRYESPTIDLLAFPNTPKSWFWSSTIDVKDSNFVWDIQFLYGKANINSSKSISSVRLVRDRQSIAKSRAVPASKKIAKPIVSDAITIEKNNTGEVTNSEPSKPKIEPNPLVKEIQKKLLSLGYSPGKADGYIGQKTINSIKEFQKENKLPVDLNINEQLLSKINSSQPRIVPQRHEDLPSTNNVKIDQNHGVCPTGKICVHP